MYGEAADTEAVSAAAGTNIFLAASFGGGGHSMTFSCSYAQEASTNDLTYQVVTTLQNYEINQLTHWADMELKFFTDETFAAELADHELAIGTPVHMQVLWDQSFSEAFPVKFYISECAVSDDDGHQFKVIDASCGASVVDSTLLSPFFSNSFIQNRYNSFSFTEEETVAEQTVTCTIGFCLQADIESGTCGANECDG